MSKFDAAIFDLDGVLVDTAKYHYLAWRRLANELNFEFTEAHNERLKGVSRMRSLEILLQVGGMDFEEATRLEMASKKNRWYVEHIKKMTHDEILPGVEEFLQKIKSHGIKISLGSASKNAMLILHNLGIEKYFDAVIDGNSVSKAKPDPEVFLAAARELGCDPCKCVVFEDAEAGIQAAKSAGMYAVGIGSADILKDADIVIRGFNGSASKIILEDLFK